MRRNEIVALTALILFVIVNYELNTQNAQAGSVYPPASFMWSWRQPPYAIIRDEVAGFPYVFPGVFVIARDPVDSDIIYVDTDNTGLCCGYTAPQDGIYRSLDRGETWQYLSSDPNNVVQTMVIHPLTPTIMLAGGANYYPPGGIYRSIDGGSNWVSVLSDKIVYDIEIDPTNPERMYAATCCLSYGTGGIYRSSDSGQTWVKVSDQWLGDIEVHPQLSNVVFGARGFSTSAEEGIYRSDDSGVTWTQIANLGGQSHIIIDQQKPSRMFAFGGSYGSIWKTEDGGQSWTSAASNLPDVGFGLTIQSAAIDPADNNTIWVGLKYSGMFVSTDGANTWNEFTTGLPFVGMSNWGPQCTAIALAANGTHAVTCHGRFYTRELAYFQFLPFIVR
jgi:photosystem II stability/assembly factor-like uncharacterized protein